MYLSLKVVVTKNSKRSNVKLRALARASSSPLINSFLTYSLITAH